MSKLAHSNEETMAAIEAQPVPDESKADKPHSSLALIEITNPLQVFSTPKGLDAIIDKIEAEVKKIDRDISTAKGRDNIRSIAAKLAKSKTAMDKMGKDLTEEQRKQINAVNAERSRAWDRMEALQEEIRKPLTDWENAEKDRVAGHEAALLHIQQLAEFATVPTTEEIEARIKAFSVLAPRNWQEFESRYNDAVKTLSGALESRLAVSKRQDEERAELERLRKEDADRKQREHEERLKAEAAAKAKEQAEAEAKREADALAAKVKAEQEEAAKREEAIKKEKSEADERAKKAEEARLAAIAKAESDMKAAVEKVERDKIAAAEKAKSEAEEAAKRERDKIEAEKKAEADATAKREADKKHKAKINNEALEALLTVLAGDNLLTADAAAKAVVVAIANKLIPHVKIEY